MDANRHQIQITAEQDAQNDVNKILWFFAGLVLNFIGILIAYVYQPSPPAAQLLQKSTEDALFYTDVYKARTRQLQLTVAITGFVFCAVLGITLVVVLFSFFFSAQQEIMR
jgi:hypothetical protein